MLSWILILFWSLILYYDAYLLLLGIFCIFSYIYPRIHYILCSLFPCELWFFSLGSTCFCPKIILQWVCWWQMFPVFVCVELMLLSSPYIRYVWLGIHFQVNTSLFSTLKASFHCCWLSLLLWNQLKVFSLKAISFSIVCFQDFFLFETEISLWHD